MTNKLQQSLDRSSQKSRSISNQRLNPDLKNNKTPQQNNYMRIDQTLTQLSHFPTQHNVKVQALPRPL